MIEQNQKTSEKTKGNAISAYLLIFISGLFLFNKTNPEINNNFVKNHTKTAMIIHLGFLITYIIFISNNLFANYSIFGIQLNNIITNIIYIFLLLILIIGIYKAKNGKTFNISKNINISKTKNILDIDGNGEINEKDKVTIILSYIPFIGYIIYGKYSNNETIKEAIKVNIFITFIISLFYIFGYTNLVALFSLAYIIFISFIGITLFSINELITIKLNKYFSPANIYLLIITLKEYLKNYFSSKNFKEFNIIEKNLKNKILENENKNESILKNKNETKIPSFLIYIPFINIIFLFLKNSKYRFHIINGIVITLLVTINIILDSLGYINTNFYILYLFPILFGIGYLNIKLAYKMPIIFDIYLLYKKIFSFLHFGVKKVKEKKAEEKEISLKPKKV